MVHSLSRPHTSVALLDDEPDVVRSVTCPRCHAGAAVTHSALETGGAWRCVRCGRHWDADRLARVAAYAVWVADRDRADRRDTERSIVPDFPRRAALVLGDLLAAVGIVLCIPFVIMAIGIPIALSVRFLLWIAGML